MLCHLFARLLIEKKKTFFLRNWILLQVRLYHVTIVYDIIRFQIDLVILASSKNFDNRLHNLKCFFSFLRDFVLASSGLFFFGLYITRRDFFVCSRENIEQKTL